jgi:N,N'-diacetyllegionaminate synthase
LIKAPSRNRAVYRLRGPFLGTFLGKQKGTKHNFTRISFSDHSGDIFSCLAATALGASILEFHAVFDKNMFGPDAKASLTISEIKKLVEGVNEITTDMLVNASKESSEAFADLKKIFQKSLAVNKNLEAGHVITFDDLESKKPAGYGINAGEFKTVLGKKLSQKKAAQDFLNETDFI